MPCTYIHIYATQEENQIDIIGACMLDNESGYENPVRMVGMKTGSGCAYANISVNSSSLVRNDITSVLKTYSEKLS